MSIRLQFDRIPPGRIIGPHRHGVETIVYVAAGEIVFEHGEELERRVVVSAGDVLYEAAAEYHRVRNSGTIDALCLLAVDDGDTADHDRSRAWHRPDPPVRRGSRARLDHDGDIARSVISRAGDFGSPTFAVSEVVVQPGVAGSWHRHLSAEHVLVVLAGRGEIWVEDVSETLEPLTGIRIAPGATHSIAATGRTPLHYVVISTPGIDPAADRVSAAAPERQLDT
jgi:quercetin dioxygenase-like cupin family protein